jgi:hypothetical protein
VIVLRVLVAIVMAWTRRAAAARSMSRCRTCPSALPDATPGVAILDGACPPGFEIKAKLSSGIFHEPGMVNYARTTPDRCYASADAAVADGLRPAKR